MSGEFGSEAASAQGATVRRLKGTDADLGTIVAQVNGAKMDIGESFTLDSLSRFVADSRNMYLVAHIDGRLAGTLHAIHYLHPSGHSYVYIDEVDTDEAFRRRGVATRLMRETTSIARGLGAREVWLGTDDGNDPAHGLYRKLGPSDIDPGVIYSYKL